MSTRKLKWHSIILKWVPRALMLGVIGFSAYVYWSYGNSSETPKQDSESRPRRVVQKVDVLRYSHFDKGVRVYDVNARRNIRLRSNVQQLERPEFIFYDKDQKEMIRITGRRCTISKDFNTITIVDDVLVKSPEGMSVNTHVLKYDYRLEQFSSPTNSTFQWRSLKGKSKGFVYTTDNDTLILPDGPEINYVPPRNQQKPPVVVTGDRGAIDRRQGFAYFDGNVHVTQGRDKVDADRIDVHFTPEGNDVHKITAQGNVKMRFARQKTSTGAESVQQKNLQTEPSPATNKQPSSISNVFTTEASTGKELEAEYAEIFFFEDGSTIKSFRSRGNCVFTLHNFGKDDKPVENRIIKAQTLEADFNQAGEMHQFHANQDVSVRVQPLRQARKETSPQTIFCKDLMAYLVPETGDVKEIHFNEEFRHVQEKRVISSEKAIYSGAAKKTDLIGKPEIEDATFRITSNEMQLFEETSGIHATGNVKSTFTRSDGKNPSTFPFSSPSNQPVYISAEKMEWDSHKAEAKYTGKAKLWQEKNVITAPVLIINDKEKTLSAYDKVHTIFYNGKEDSENKPGKGKEGRKKQSQSETQVVEAKPEPQTQTSPANDEKPKEPENKLFASTSQEGEVGAISVDAAIMNYIEKDRIIHFEKDVRIKTPSTKITSSKADFYLEEKTSELDRLYAQGEVKIQHEKKQGSGDTATYYSKDQKLVLEGGPKLSEAGSADIHGKMLTLFLTDGRILVDGQVDGRATTTLEMHSTPIISSTPSKTSDKNAPDAKTKNGEPNKEL